MANKWSIYVDSYGKIVSELDDQMGEWVWHDEVASIESRLAELEKDAARYRFLRDRGSHELVIRLSFEGSEDWDDIVDRSHRQ